MAWDINWHSAPGDAVLQHPLYQKWSTTAIGDMQLPLLKQDLGKSYADNASAAVVAYLCWLIRVKTLQE